MKALPRAGIQNFIEIRSCGAHVGQPQLLGCLGIQDVAPGSKGQEWPVA